MTNTETYCARCHRPILDSENAPTDGSGLCAVDADPDGTVSVKLARYLSLIMDRVVELDVKVAELENLRDYYMRSHRAAMANEVCDRIDALVEERVWQKSRFRRARQAGIDELDDPIV